MKEAVFLEEAEKRLGESRRLSERAVLPSFLQPLAYEAGLRGVRLLVGVSFVVAIGTFLLMEDGMWSILRAVFLYE